MGQLCAYLLNLQDEQLCLSRPICMTDYSSEGSFSNNEKCVEFRQEKGRGDLQGLQSAHTITLCAFLHPVAMYYD